MSGESPLSLWERARVKVDKLSIQRCWNTSWYASNQYLCATSCPSWIEPDVSLPTILVMIPPRLTQETPTLRYRAVVRPSYPQDSAR